jgi:hypothetical protein
VEQRAHSRRRGAATVVVALLGAILGTVVAVGGPPSVVHALPGLPSCPVGLKSTDVQCNQVAAPGPLGPISIFGDSVLVGSGSGLSTPGLADQLAGAGWGPVNFLAGKGNSTGRHQGAGKPSTASYWFNRWRAEGFDAPVVMINLGNNDMAYCPADVGCMKQTIDYLLDVIGPQVEVWWPKATTVDYMRAGAWNSALMLAAQERPNLHVWDWPTAFTTADPPFLHDKYFIHLASGAEYARRSALMTADVTTAFGPSRRVGPNAPVATAAGVPADYLPIDITRTTTGLFIPPGSIATVDVNGLAPADATAVALTLEAHDPTGPGYLTTFPCDEGRPMTSNVNFVAGQRRAAQALVALSAARTVCIFSYDATYVDIDVQGWFVRGSASRLTGTVPGRLLDTRETGRATVNVIQVPAGSTAVAVSMVGLNSTVHSSLTAWACDQAQPNLAQIHFGPDEIVAGAAYVKPSAAGTICVTTSSPADVVVDLTGVFSVGGRLRYTPTVVQRMIDTREGIGGWLGRVDSGQQLDMHPAPPGAEAVSGTLTMVQPTIAGWLRATPCGVSQLSSSVNAPAGAILANSLTVALSADQGLCVEPWRGAHVLFDISGWWAP